MFSSRKEGEATVKRAMMIVVLFCLLLTLLPTNEGFCDWSTGSKLPLINLNNDLSLNTILEKELEISAIIAKEIGNVGKINIQFPGMI